MAFDEGRRSRQGDDSRAGAAAAPRRAFRLVAGALGLALFGIAATPAHAETIRSRQWHLTAMGAEEIWGISRGEGVTIALIDTGVEEVPELKGRLVPGKDFPGAETASDKGRGTTQAAVIAGTGKGPGGRESAFGLAPGAKVMPLDITDGYTGKGSLADQQKAVEAGLAPALRHAANSQAQIIDISVSLPAVEGAVEVRDAVNYALSKGKLIFAGVGDADYDDTPLVGYPAMLPGVVGVGAVDKKVTWIKGSAVGPDVDVAAPGAEVISACAGGTGLCKSKGTRVASAVASAAAALVWAKHPEWTRNQVLRVLLNTVSAPAGGEVRSDYIGYGALRPLRALRTPGDPGAPDKFPLPDLANATPTPTPSTATPSPTPSASHAVVEAATPAEPGHSAGFWIALGVAAAGLLCAGVGAPLLVAERRRGLA
ncbi:S8 family serine peptidase [Streptomyces sp. NPDC003863]